MPWNFCFVSIFLLPHHSIKHHCWHNTDNMPYLHWGIFREIPIFDDAPNLVVSLMITIFALGKESYLHDR